MGFAVGCDDDGGIYSFVDAGFEQERHVVNHHGFWICSSSLSGQSGLLPGDAGVDDVFELPAFFGIAEDDASESLSVERAVLIEHGLPKESDNLSPSRLAWLDDFMGQFVGIDDDRAALLEHLGDGALAGGDTPCKPNEKHGGGA